MAASDTTETGVGPAHLPAEKGLYGFAVPRVIKPIHVVTCVHTNVAKHHLKEGYLCTDCFDYQLLDKRSKHDLITMIINQQKKINKLEEKLGLYLDEKLQNA
jgi:cell division protein YceG involved in septum cleavage